MTLEQYRTIIDAYLDFYPDERVDIQVNDEVLKEALEADANGKEINQQTLNDIMALTYSPLRVITYYPELTLTNDSGKQYRILDVYVCTSFPSFSISMGRTTYTQDEVDVGYRHSHIRTGNFKELSGFCTGLNDTPINRMITRFSEGRYGDFNTFIQSFIIEIKRLIRIESNEGGPYICFSKVGKNSVQTPLRIRLNDSPYFQNERTKELFKKFIEYYCSLHLDRFYYDGRNWQLDDTDTNFIKKVTRAARAWRKTKNANIYMKANKINGLYYKPTQKGKYHIYSTDYTQWTFKGSSLKLKVIENGNKPDIKDECIVKTEYISMLYSYLINLINGIYANIDKYKDSIHSRAYKIKTALIKEM